MRRLLMACVALIIPLVAPGCGGGSGVNVNPVTPPAVKLATSTVLVTVVNPFTSSRVAGATVTQSLDYDSNTQQPVNVVATQNTDSNGTTTFAAVTTSDNCFSTPITPTYGFIRTVDCNFPPLSQVTLNKF